jgi:glycosyltransferase involved in cell wall biosynthesis
MPVVSIITVCLNNKAGLEKTIQSVVEQTFRNYEFIVIDGGSTDGSLEVLKKYSSEIAYRISENDTGIYNAMNKGIVKAQGEYCLFLNSGDYLVDSNVLSNVFIKELDEDIIYGDMIIDDGNGKMEYGEQPLKLTLEFLIAHTLWHPVSFIKRSLFQEFGLYNESNKIVSDYEFFLRAIIIGQASTRHLAIPVAVFNTNGIGSSKGYDDLHKKEKRAVQEKLFSRKIIEAAERLIEIKKSAIHLVEPADKYPQIKRVVTFIGNTLIKIRGRIK